jgi:dTDP-4-amino-4,6-dideoxygalactose transaminase
MTLISNGSLPSDARPRIVGLGTFQASTRAKQLVMNVLENNRLSYGPMTQRFEAEFARLHGSRFGVMSNSGTSALQLALQAMKELHGWNDGDEVIVPAVTFVATANIVLHNRMVPVLVDVDERYYEINPALIAKAITAKTRAIIPVHLFGQPADMAPIIEVAKRHGLKIIEDSAETMFANYNGKRVGSLGEIGCFSTYVAHLIVTGVGGLNTTSEPDYAVKIRSLLNHGRDSIYLSIDDDNSKMDQELRIIAERRFRFTSVGHSFRVTEMEAALGVAELENWQSVIEQRRRNAKMLDRGLSRFADRLQTPVIRPGCDHSFMMYPIVLLDQDKRNLVAHLEQKGIETRDMLPLTNQPIYHHRLGWREDDFQIAKWINHNGFYFGCHQNLSEVDLEYIIDAVGEFFRGERMRVSEGITLALLANQQTSADMFDVESVPSELYADIVIFDSGMAETARTELERKGLKIIKTGNQDALSVIASGKDMPSHDGVLLFPLNGQWDPRDIPRLLIVLNRGYDMVVASRFLIGGERQGQRGRLRSFGNRLFNMLANLLLAGNVSDAFSSFRAVRRSKLATISLAGRGLTKFFALSVVATKSGWRIQEIPTAEMTRSTKQVMSDSLANVVPALAILIREWWSRRGPR